MRLTMISDIDFGHDGIDGPDGTGDSDGAADLYVMFHGYGNDEQEMIRIIKAIDPEADYMTVRGPIGRRYLGGYAWYDSVGWDDARIQSQCSAIGDRIVTLLDANGLRRRRIVLVGFSQGGYLSYRLLADHPDVFDAAVLLAPSFHDDRTVTPDLGGAGLGGDGDARGDGLGGGGRPAVFLGYGTLDRQIPDRQKEAIRKALAGFARVEERTYEGMRHDVCEREFEDIREFLRR
ncbi:alpha/beta hydrolase [Bifidobacterium simiarum]|uniref:Phospholipase n=1 Tax=Bifidobacterium simiarum TaxID=2045441 RepID=A0A2M9HC66_9BIFI|nr:alpha/beta fold hydrolase [Bifidobacterium simiarum]MBT1166569.1 alpha/beta fold hydrolase [Bifidobacterium simiarum]PJM74396.1 phospholipase [Bifidobacterium simiarum]